ncbi:hypothetical protein BDAP_001982 [Binucleata daphniae]
MLKNIKLFLSHFYCPILYNKYKDETNITNDEIFDFETTENLQMCLKDSLSSECVLEYTLEAKIVLHAFIMKRCYDTKINYIAKSRYYKDKEQTKRKILQSNAQLNAQKIIDDIIADKSIFEIHFDLQNVYSAYSIVCMFTLSTINDRKLKYLTKLADWLIVKIDMHIINIHENEITKYFDKLINNDKRKHTELEKEKIKLINQINSIKSPTLKELEEFANEELESDNFQYIYSCHRDEAYEEIYEKVKKYELID